MRVLLATLLIAATWSVLAATSPLASPATAATEVRIEGRLGPVIRGVPRRPKSLTLRLGTYFSGDQPGGLPPILDRAVMRFPFGSRLNGRLFPSCTANTINRRGERRCPRGSKIGAGRAVGVGANVVQRLRVSLYNGRRGRSVIFYLTGNNPLRVNVAFKAPLKRLRRGRFNYRLTVPVPKNLQRVAGVDLAVREFIARAGATRRVRGRRRGYIEGYACPPGALVPVQGLFSFLESPAVRTDSYLSCGPAIP